MAYSHIKAGKDSFFGLGRVEGVALNSLACESGMFLKLTANGSDYFIDKAVAGSTIIGISSTEKTFDSDNETVAKEKVNYVPKTDLDTFIIKGVGQTIVFSIDFAATHTINLRVNGVAMTQVGYNASNAQTMTDLAAQLNTNFSAVATFAVSGAHTITIVPVGSQESVVVTNIVLAGTTPPTATYALLTLTTGDFHKFYDITAAQYINMVSESTSTGTFLAEDPVGMEFSIVNA